MSPLIPVPSIMRTAVLLLATVLTACASGPSEDEQARIEDYFNRGMTYYAAGRFPQAYDQAIRALELDPEDGRLNLLAGRSLLMQRSLKTVAAALPFLEKAEKEMDNYKAPYALAEFHFRYGSLLFEYAQQQRLDLENFPDMDAQMQAQRLKKNAEREQTARSHFRDSRALLEQVREMVPQDLDTLEMLGQCCALLDDEEGAQEALTAALVLLDESRQYKNLILGTDANLSLDEEARIRRDLAGDIRREVAIHYLVAGLHRRANRPHLEEQSYNAILALKPGEHAARFSRAEVRYELGRLAEAAADMRMFISSTKLGPDSEVVQRAVTIVHEFEQMQGATRSSALNRR